jgi:hypothetical protein
MRSIASPAPTLLEKVHAVCVLRMAHFDWVAGAAAFAATQPSWPLISLPLIQS